MRGKGLWLSLRRARSAYQKLFRPSALAFAVIPGLCRGEAIAAYVRSTSDSGRNAALPRTVEMCHKRTHDRSKRRAQKLDVTERFQRVTLSVDHEQMRARRSSMIVVVLDPCAQQVGGYGEGQPSIACVLP